MGKTKCRFCTNDVGNPHIKCSICKDIFLCLQCFACGAELGSHSRYHEYQVLSDNPPVVFQPVFSAPTWNADEELKLLDAIEQYGFGNWEDIASYVGGKTAADCEEHYTDFFVHGSIGRATYSTESAVNVEDHTGTLDAPLSPSLSSVIPPIELSEAERRMLGYMPYRDDYERDMDNDSESILASLTPVADDEDDLEKTTRASLVSQYRQRLRQRLHRRRIAREHGVLKGFLEENAKVIRHLACVGKTHAQAAACVSGGAEPRDLRKKPSGSKEDREFKEKMRIFAQFHSPSEHEIFFENLRKERHLKSRIKDLQRCRKQGIRSLSECRKFEGDRLRREKRKERLKKQRNNKPLNGWKVTNGEADIKQERCNGALAIVDSEHKEKYSRRLRGATIEPTATAPKQPRKRRRRRKRTGWN